MMSEEAIQLLLRIEKLSLQDRIWLLEGVAATLRREVCEAGREDELAAMAADPDIQREMRRIEEDFRALEARTEERPK
jgi:hypothetical protein